MALNLIPGAQVVTTPVTVGATVAQVALGDKGYSKVRGAVTWTYSAINGISPIPVFAPLFPVKIAVFTVLILLFMIAFSMRWWTAGLLAYVGQAVVVTILCNWLIDKFLSYGFGV